MRNAQLKGCRQSGSLQRYSAANSQIKFVPMIIDRRSERFTPPAYIRLVVDSLVMKQILWFVLLLMVLILLEVAQIYLIMPFPGSQLEGAADTSRLQWAYGLHRYGPYGRAVGILALIGLAYQLLRTAPQRYIGWLVMGGLALYGLALYLVNGRLMADQLFQQPHLKRMVSIRHNTIPLNKLVIGIVENGDARAYPLQVIGYHHQVRDTVGGQPVLITYCTVCRTGRVYSPLVNGKAEAFRLVGMDHYNALFEDESTGSWWRQATGEAILGPCKGQLLRAIDAEQVSLSEWAAAHPTTLIMQADPSFKEETDSLASYDLGVGRGQLTVRDSASWHNKSWVVGITLDGSAKAFDWNQLIRHRVINDAVGRQPVVLAVAPDGVSFRVWSRRVGDRILSFSSTSSGALTDHETGTSWSPQGLAVSGPLAGQRLQRIQAYQEFWHSWRSFHPQTSQAQ